jgi:DNA-binding PadR family transcriptional regulator
MGLYAPSPGTIYPRLQRLEAEGLVTQSREGGRKVYRITEAGREELQRRQGELDELESEIGSSVSGLAREIRDEVHGTIRDLKQELRQAAREIRREQRHENRWRREEHRWDREDDQHRGNRHEADAPASRLQHRLREFLARTEVLQRAGTSEAQLRECVAILDEAFERIRQTLREQR